MMGIPRPTQDVGSDVARNDRRFRMLAEAIPQIVWATRPDGYCDYQNRRWFDYSGMTAEESSGTGWIDAVHPEDRARLEPAWARTLEGTQGFEFEYRLRRADGAFRRFLARAEPICDDEGSVVRWFGTCTDIDDRRRAEDEALRRNDERLKLAADAARLGYWDWDIISDTITWSESLEEISATSPAAFGRTIASFLALVHPDDRERVGGSVRSAVDRGTPYEEEFRLARPDGIDRWCLTKGQAYFDRDGRAVRMSGIHVDITARKEAEERLRRSEERFRASVDTLLDCFAIYTAVRDERGRIIDFRTEHVNRPACLDNLMTREQQVGRNLLELLPAHRESGLFDRYCLVVESGESLDIEEIVYQNAFGGERLGRVYAIRVSKLDDGYVAAWRDITERKRTEESFLENQRRFRKLADSNIIGVIFGDIHGGISYANDEYLRILGYTREEFEAGRIGWATVTPPEWLPVDERAIAQARDGDGAAAPYEKEYIRKDGTRIPVLVGFTLFGEAETVAFILDISERKRAEEALREADRRKDEFLAMLAHELRNPLSALGHALRVIRTPGATDEDREWASDIADRQFHNLVRLIDDLLDVSRISRGKIHLKKAHLDAATVVARAVESVRPFIEARGHELTVAIEDRPLPIDGDPTRLEQVLANLLNNAAKYTDEGGRIRIDARIEGDEVVFRVRDTGVGIAPDMLPGVFDLFAQVDSSIDRSQGGLGIGLALVRMLVEMHGGRVAARSESTGQGSEFTVRLPLAPGEAHAGAEEDRTTVGAPCPAKPCRILLVDDNVDMLQAMARLLELSGHEVVTAQDGPTAVETARAFRPEVVLLDIGLPGMSGYDVAETIRREGMTDALLIAISGYTQDKDRAMSLRAGFDHHLGKPVDLDALLAIIEGPDSRTQGARSEEAGG